MIYGLDEYYDGLILEAKSEEEIKKILEYQFVKSKGVPQEILDYVFSVDPTKKKSFTKWTLMQWERDKESIAEAIKSKRLPKLFQYFQERAGSGLALNAMPSFDAAMEKLPEEDPIIGQKPEGAAGDFEFVYDTPEWKIAVPHTYEADRFLGQGCRWCTAGAFGDNDQWWNRYSPKGPIWVNFDMRKGETCPMDNKEYPYTRYQFLFEWEYPKGELMDCRDKEVKFEKIDMPEEVKDFYEEQDPKYRERIDNDEYEEDPEDRYQNYVDDRMNHSHVILCIDDTYYLSIMPEEEDDYIFNENCCYYVYDEEDTSDPICWDAVDPDNAVVLSYNNDMPVVIIKDNRDKLHALTWDSNGSRWGGGSFSDRIISFYKDLGRACMFYDESDEQIKIYAIGGLETAIDVNDNFENIKFIELDSSSVEGYENGEWLQVDFEKYSSLIYINPYGTPEVIVKRDIPISEDYSFTIGFNDGYAYIQGKYAKHWLVDDDEDEHLGFDIIDEIVPEIYSVEFKNGEVNVYEKENNRFIFDENVRTVSEWWGNGILQVVTLDGRQFYYNLNSMEMALPIADEYHKVGNIWEGVYKEGYCEIYTCDDKSKFIHLCRAKSITHKLDDSHYLITFKDDMMRVVTTDGNISDFPIAAYGDICRPYVYITKEKGSNSEVMIYNYISGEIEFKNSAVYRTSPFLKKGDDCYLPVKNKSGFFNILRQGKLLLKENTYKKIYTYFNSPMVCAETDDRLFFFDVVEMRELPPKNGVLTSKITVGANTPGGLFVNSNTLHLMMVDNNHLFNYNPYTQEINPSGWGEDKENEKRQIMQSMGSAAPQIAESFKNMYKRIIDARNKTL